MYILRLCGSLQWTFLWGFTWEFYLVPELPQVFSVRGFEVLFPGARALSCEVCLIPQFFPLVYAHANVGLPTPPATSLPCPPDATLPWVLSTPAAYLCPSYGLDECFFFNSLVVRLLYNLIFWPFWLFFVFKFGLVLLLIVQTSNMFVPMPTSWQESLPSIIFTNENIT